MKKRLILIASLVMAVCCFFAVYANAAQCDSCTDSWTVTMGDEGYLGSISAVNKCSACGTLLAEETIDPMFETVGYSYNENNGGITQHFAVNKDSVARYEELTGLNVRYGAVIAAKEVVGEGAPIDENGVAVDPRVKVAYLSDTEYAVFDIMLNNIPEGARATAELICCAFVIVDGEVTYIDNGKMVNNAVANTYDDVVKLVEPGAEEEEKKTLRVLTIGNSFSDDSMEYVYKIAKESGYEYVELGNVRRDSGSLANHINDFNSTTKNYAYRYWADGATGWNHNWDKNATLKSVLELGIEWDYVVFQQVSDQSGNASTYDDLNTLMDLVRPYCPTAKFAWLMTWTYRADYVTKGPSYESIISAVTTKITTNTNIDVVIPCGTAIENAKGSYITDVQIQRDARHLNYGIGRYIASLTFFKALTGESIDGMTYPTSDTEGHSATTGDSKYWVSFAYTDEINAICIESANNAIANPYAVTPTQYAD